MKMYRNLSLLTLLAISSFGATLNVDTRLDEKSSNNFSNTKQEVNNQMSDLENQAIDEATPKIRKQNDVLTKTSNTELLNDPEVIRLINEAYKNGFTAGAEESEFVMKKKLEKMSRYMDSLFAFHKLYLEGKLEPPKIGVVNEPVQVTKNGKVMVIQQEYLEIIEPARFIDQPKTWKNFLIN